MDALATNGLRFYTRAVDLYSDLVTFGTGVLYTAPTLTSVPTGSAGTALLKSLVVCNTDSSSRTYTITIGGTTAAFSIFSGATIAANTTHVHVFPDDAFPLSDAETINGFASVADKVAVRTNIVQVTY